VSDVDHTETGETATAEIVRLRARIDELQARLVETEAWANRAVAEAQDKVYWLDRWHIDLNALMERPGADEFRASIRAVRGVYRFFKRAKRSFRE